MMYVCMYDNHAISMKGKQLIKIYIFPHLHLRHPPQTTCNVGFPTTNGRNRPRTCDRECKEELLENILCFFSMGTYALALYSLLFLFCHLHGGDVIEYHSQEHSARQEIRPNTDLTGDSPVNEAQQVDEKKQTNSYLYTHIS